jgi:hypothetical protein
MTPFLSKNSTDGETTAKSNTAPCKRVEQVEEVTAMVALIPLRMEPCFFELLSFDFGLKFVYTPHTLPKHRFLFGRAGSWEESTLHALTYIPIRYIRVVF